MKTFEVDLKKEYGTEGGKLTAILSGDVYDNAEANEKRTRPAVIVVPGGGYGMVSKREGEPVAAAFLSRGFQTFILTYLTASDGEYAYPEQLTELAAAADYVKKHAKELHVNAEEVFAVGFSAGGHLAADLAVEWQNIEEITGKKLDCKPTAVGLSYPVISEKTAYKGSHENLLQGYTQEAKAELLKRLNLDEAVSEQTPPAFIWTTAEDNCVPSENSLMYALQLAKRKIPYELHVYPQGGHGASTCNVEMCGEMPWLKRNAHWLDDCASFFRLFTKEKF